MDTPFSYLRRQARRLGHLVAGRARHARAVRTAVGVLRTYRRYFLSVERLTAQRNEEAARALLSRAHARAARRFVRLAEQNGGGWVKAAQFFSCRPDVLPREYITELQKLQNDAPAVAFAELEPVLAARWGRDWEQRFERFERQPVATASIAQVHRARLKSGEEVAVKIRLPGVVEHFHQDEATFRIVAGILSPLVRELDLSQVIDQLLEMTLSELDFRQEADNLKRFSALPHRPRIRVPALFEALSGEDLLVTSWMHGDRLRDHLDRHPERANDLLGELFQSYIQQVTQFGMYQADPHPGNFIVDAEGRIAILDFGALAYISAEERDNYARLLFACVQGQTEGIGELFEKAGFIGGNAQTLQALAGYVLTDRLAREGIADSMVELLELFREQRVSMPDSWIAISRVLITIGGFLMAYGVPLQWSAPRPLTA
ncbi:MAG: ABC1 kinase family protein [Pseudomonadota bacterium]